jgi:hypothetical protein
MVKADRGDQTKGALHLWFCLSPCPRHIGQRRNETETGRQKF